jgi:hypothetical protein
VSTGGGPDQGMNRAPLPSWRVAKNCGLGYRLMSTSSVSVSGTNRSSVTPMQTSDKLMLLSRALDIVQTPGRFARRVRSV